MTPTGRKAAPPDTQRLPFGGQNPFRNRDHRLPETLVQSDFAELELRVLAHYKTEEKK